MTHATLSGRRRCRRYVRAVAVASSAPIVLATLAVPAEAATTVNAASKTIGDINGDGYADEVTAAPKATVHGKAKAGYVVVTYGSAGGVNTGHHQGISQAHTGIPGTVEYGDEFGSSLAVGDVNSDGYADLVVGAFGEDIGSAQSGKGAGTVTVVFGSASGLSTKAISFHPSTTTYAQRFGAKLTVGDFNKDGSKDIAASDCGSTAKVWLVYGSKTLSSTPKPPLKSFTPGGGGVETSGLATGDINGDGYDDLLTEASNDDPADEASISMYNGSSSGLGAHFGNSVGLPFGGYELAVGDINGDGKDDLTIDTGFSDGPDGYKLRTYPGSTNGLDTENPVVWQGNQHDGEGVRLTDLDGDGHADLVIADTQAVDSDGINNAGAITVLKGTSSWLTDAGAKTWTLDTPGVYGVREGNDRFGADVAPADYNGDGIDDLAIGVPGKHDDSGAVSMLYGSSGPLTSDGSIIFGPREVGWPYDNAQFGQPLGFAPPR